LFGVTQCYSYSKIKGVIINCYSAWRISNKSSVKSRTQNYLSRYQGNTRQYEISTSTVYYKKKIIVQKKQQVLVED
jgi:hypothetical protein